MLDNDAAVAACVAWFREKGGASRKLAPAIFPDTGRGMIALDDIEEGEVLVEVPESILMTTRSAAQGELGSLLADADPTSALCLHLLHERSLGAKSAWASFIRILPPSYDTAIYFSAEDLAELQDDKAAVEAINAQKLLRQMYDDVAPILAERPKLFPPENFTFNLFQWASGVVQTRACYMKVNSAKGDTSCLVPFADFLNHSNIETDAGFDAAKRCYVIVTKTSFKKGSEVFISYGKHGNNTLLSLYGFLMPSNSEDVVTLDEQFVSAKLDAVEPNAELRTRKQQLIENLPLTRNFFAKWREISWNVIAIARIMHMRANELSDENVFAAVFEEKPELLKHEAEVSASVRALIAALLSHYATSISQDEQLLAASPTLSYRRRCAVQLRLDQKRLLLSCRDALSLS